MSKRSVALQEERRHQRRVLLVAVASVLLVAAFAFGAYRYFAGRAVLLRADQLEAAMTESLRQVGQKQPDTVQCPDRDLRRDQSVICDVQFTDGSTTKLRFGVRGRPGDVTPVITGV
jgi:hypothetical protein